jgi:hypothetical protein
MKKLLYLCLLFSLLVPSNVFSGCEEPGKCEMKCDDTHGCWYIDEYGQCWEYDKYDGYYPCETDYCPTCEDWDDDDCDWWDDDCDNGDDFCFISIIR